MRRLALALRERDIIIAPSVLKMNIEMGSHWALNSVAKSRRMTRQRGESVPQVAVRSIQHASKERDK